LPDVDVVLSESTLEYINRLGSPIPQLSDEKELKSLGNVEYVEYTDSLLWQFKRGT
jgi:hypothetical protein